MPRWVDDPAQCFQRGLLPTALLRPGDLTATVDQWLSDATKAQEPADTDPDALAKYKAYTATRDRLKAEITILRERVTHFNLPYLSLPADTKKDVALQVFINMNTNSKHLTLYDIIVAEVENIAQKSLHELTTELSAACPEIVRYGAVSDLILSTSALLQEKVPNARGMLEMDKRTLVENWDRLTRGLKRMATLLDREKIFDEHRLPTNAVLPVIAAAYDLVPNDTDFLAKGDRPCLEPN